MKIRNLTSLGGLSSNPSLDIFTANMTSSTSIFFFLAYFENVLASSNKSVVYPKEYKYYNVDT